MHVHNLKHTVQVRCWRDLLEAENRLSSSVFYLWEDRRCRARLYGTAAAGNVPPHYIATHIWGTLCRTLALSAGRGASQGALTWGGAGLRGAGREERARGRALAGRALRRCPDWARGAAAAQPASVPRYPAAPRAGPPTPVSLRTALGLTFLGNYSDWDTAVLLEIYSRSLQFLLSILLRYFVWLLCFVLCRTVGEDWHGVSGPLPAFLPEGHVLWCILLAAQLQPSRVRTKAGTLICYVLFLTDSGWLLLSLSFLALEIHLFASHGQRILLGIKLIWHMKDSSFPSLFKRRNCVLSSLCSASAIFFCSLEWIALSFINLTFHHSTT